MMFRITDPDALGEARALAKECVCEIKQKQAEFTGEAINWGDLHVSDVRVCLQVVIEECSSPKIVEYILERFEKAGFDPDILDVRTEW